MSMFGVAEIENGETVTIEQRADPKSFLGLSLKNGLLNLATLTLYRFWGKTEVRRRLWSSIHINGEPLEYTGRGIELFVGFLLAAGVVGAPFLLSFFGAQFLGPGFALFAFVVIYVFLGYLVGFGRFAAFRYMASRTVWRGLRFHMEGSASAYGLRFLGYLFLSAISFGWFWPAAQRRLSGALWDSLRFGDRRFRYDIERARRQEPVYGAYIMTGLLMGFAYLAFGVVMTLLLPGFGQEVSEPGLRDIAMIYLALLFVAPLFAIAVAPYQAASLRTVAAGVQLQQVRGQLDLKWWPVAWLYITNIVLVTVSLGFLMPFVQARTSRFLIDRLRTPGEANLVDVRQAPQGPKTGEGLADAFGLAPI